MPTYDYICDNCKHEFEAFESIVSNPQTECPTCHEPKLRRKIGPGAAIIFKGSGFYQTDYRSDSYKKAAKADSKPADSGTSGKSSSDSSGGSASPSPTTPTPTPSAGPSSGGSSS
jgi:putative FmdB family regulatory protein